MTQTQNPLPPGWRMARFDEMAENISERVQPSEVETEYYVGLEHLDPESLKIRRWGSPDEVEATKLRFQPGDIIFGKRRAYQRKLAVAEFEGICSAHAMVLRAREDVALKEFLPFLMQSETFYERALSISVGSLSPTINWKSLARQEFPLPPRDEQRRIAEILWAADEAYTHNYSALHRLDTLRRSALTQATTKGLVQTSCKATEVGEIPEHWRVVQVGDLLSLCQYGLSMPLHSEGQYPILRMMNFQDGVVVADDLKYVDLTDNAFRAVQLEKGDILFNRTNSADLVGKVGIFRLSGDYVFASYLIRLRVNKDLVIPEYLNFYLNSDAGQKRILSYATAGVSQSNINASNLQKVLVPLPPTLAEQQQLVAYIEHLDTSKVALRRHIEALDQVRRQLRFELFEIVVES